MAVTGKPRDRTWLSLGGLAGGLVMFAVQSLVVLVLVGAAWVVAVFVLAFL
jgi:hypothetical protein